MNPSSVEAFRMSPQQRQLWSRFGAGDSARALVTLELTGPLDEQRLRSALDAVVARHEILRTLYRRQLGIKWPLQVPLETLAPVWEPEAGAVALDAAEGPVLGAELTELGGGRHRLELSALALSADEVSLLTLAGELAEAYGDPGRFGPSVVDDPLQYVQFSEWQIETAEEAQEDEVPAELGASADGVGAPALPGVSAVVNGAPIRSAFLPLAWDAGCGERLADRARRTGVAERSWLFATWRVFLGRLDPSSRQRIEVVLDGRKFEEFEGACGRFVRRAPLVLDGFEDFSVDELARRSERLLTLAEEHQELLGNDERTPDGGDAVTFHHRPHLSAREAAGIRFAVLTCRSAETPAVLGLRSWGSPVAGLELVFDPARVGRSSAARWGKGFLTLLQSALAAPERRACRLAMLANAERRTLAAWGEAPPRDEGDAEPASLVERLAAAAVAGDDRPAVVAGGVTWSYDELWRRSGQLAGALRRADVQREEPVGLLLERSAGTVSAIVGTWRAGAAYLPLDPSLPDGRLTRLADAAGVRRVVTVAALMPRVPAGRDALDLEALEEMDVPADDTLPDPRDLGPYLAYVLFTSGSTGEPKGVMVEHRQLAAYVRGAAERLEADGVASWALASTFAADLGLTALLLPLATGGAVHLVSTEEASDPAAFGRRLTGVEGLKIVPSHLAALMSGERPAGALPQKRLVLGGEVCPPSLIERIQGLAPELRIFNHYGPTETTVGVTAGEIPRREPGADASAPISLGRPLSGRRIFVLDPWGELAPAGVTGELCLGGAGLARGYLGRPAATAERFVPDSWSGGQGQRLYRTGDRGGFRPDGPAAGELRFLGRIDHQVKLRGFRIELGEVEATLLLHEAIRQAVAVVRGDGEGRRLVAYAVMRPGPRISDEELMRHLAERLPEYMMPAAVVRLDALPRNANGKLDRAALPAPETAQAQNRYVAPRDALEQTLCKLWAEILGVERVGIRDDFFALGGDSILAIQLIGRAGREGLGLTPQQIFEQRTIERLAPWVTAGAQTVAEQGKVTGELPLTPIQRWFLEGERVRPEHFNQSVLLATPRPLDGRTLRRVIDYLAEHHDILRCRFSRRDDGGYRAEIVDMVELPVDTIDLTAFPEDRRVRRLEDASAEAQGGFDLAHGPLFRAVVFDLGDGGRLLLASHHLLVDGVSWRILLSDLERVYRQLEAGEAPSLQPKTTSFRHWARILEERVQAGAFADQLEYWRDVGARAPEEPGGGGTVTSARRASASLDVEATQALLQDVPPVYNTGINDALLAALVLAYGRRTGQPRLLVDLEGHGREEIVDGLDLSRTVGWFTTHYPVWLDLTGATEPGPALNRVKETLRSVPTAGIGHGLLRWLDDGDSAACLRAQPEPPLSFNYLGRFDGVLEEEAELRLAPESPGPERAPEELRSHRYEVSGSVLGGRLQLGVTYSDELDDAAAMEAWIRDTCDQLRSIVAHCRTPEAGGFTPSDFPLADLGMEDLEQLVQVVEDLDGELRDGRGAES